MDAERKLLLSARKRVRGNPKCIISYATKFEPIYTQNLRLLQKRSKTKSAHPGPPSRRHYDSIGNGYSLDRRRIKLERSFYQHVPIPAITAQRVHPNRHANDAMRRRREKRSIFCKHFTFITTISRKVSFWKRKQKEYGRLQRVLLFSMFQRSSYRKRLKLVVIVVDTDRTDVSTGQYEIKRFLVLILSERLLTRKMRLPRGTVNSSSNILLSFIIYTVQDDLSLHSFSTTK